MSVSYKSYCWAMGSTSFRTDQLNRKIETQLRELDAFWKKPPYRAQRWSRNEAVQAAYYKRLQEAGFLSGDAPRPAKDARQKTSGLVELGFIDEERRLTEAGRKVLAVSVAGDFGMDESDLLGLAKDSHLYFLQLLKATKQTEAGTVRPFVVLLWLLKNVAPDEKGNRFLYHGEFSELLPMCIDPKSATAVLSAINEARARGGHADCDKIILSILMDMGNYREALEMFRKTQSVDEELMCLVGMNRKSGAGGNARYDAPYFGVYTALLDLARQGVTERRAMVLKERIGELSGNIRRFWFSHFFVMNESGRMPSSLAPAIRRSGPLFRASDEESFRIEFFKLMHLIKAKATLKDYSDLNRRYFALSDVLLFADGKVRLDAMPRVLVDRISSWIDRQVFAPCDKLHDAIPLQELVDLPLPDKATVVADATGLSMDEVERGGGVRAVLKKDRKARFDRMLADRFPRNKVGDLLALVENRQNDSNVQSMVTDNADVPTIFEYLVGIAWYYISGMEGDVLSYMNLSLGADFLPKTHAGGGEADIVWRYEDNPPHYAKHVLLIEVTLSERDSQRRMEMEPVSRHLGEYRLSHPGDDSSYCTFVSTNLNFNVIADFRGKRSQIYYNPKDAGEKVDGLKIIPIDTRMLRRMLEKNIGYADVCAIFSKHDAMPGDPVEWHDSLRQEIEA